MYLKVLNLSDNQMTSLPESIGNLITLNNLNLDNNALTSLPESMGNLICLNNLSVENNKLVRVPMNIINLSEENNALLGVPKIIKKRLKEQRKLNLSKNPLCLGTLISIAASAYSENQLCLGDNRAIYDQIFSNKERLNVAIRVEDTYPDTSATAFVEFYNRLSAQQIAIICKLKSPLSKRLIGLDDCAELTKKVFNLSGKKNRTKKAIGITRIDELSFVKIEPEIYVKGILSFSQRQAQANKEDEEFHSGNAIIPAQIYDSTINDSRKGKVRKFIKKLKPNSETDNNGLDLALLDKSTIRRRRRANMG